MDIKYKIESAAGRKKVDTLFCNGNIINVFTGEIIQNDIAVKDGYICGFGRYDAREEIDLKGLYISPGFVDGHVHIESSMVTPPEFAKAVIACGTTTIVADPHEIANVLGIKGIEYMIKSAENQLMNILFAMPSSVPATNMETSGALLDAEKTASMLLKDEIKALAEMMNYPGIIHTDPDVMEKIRAAEKSGKPVDGHAPGLTGKELFAYAAAGILSDHECTTPQEAMEKLRLGMQIMIREGTCAKNLTALVSAIDDHTWRRMMWCTDDRHPEEILKQGHIDHIIRKAVKAGIDPVRAIQMATINPADYFGIRDIGAIAPGRRADFVLFKDFNDIYPEKVYAKGILAAENGKFCSDTTSYFVSYPQSMNLDITRIDLTIPFISNKIRVIEALPDQVLTGHKLINISEEKGNAVANSQQDIIKIAVIERYSGKTGTGKGFITGLGITKGAIASSVAHDSHNIIVAGTNDADMIKAVKAVVDMKGGFAVACDNEIMESLALPVAGLMSEKSLIEVNASMKKIILAAKKIGSPLKDPFMTLGFLALPVIPKLKITDKGLVDVEKFEIVDLFVD